MLPQVFKPNHPVFELAFAPEHQRDLGFTAGLKQPIHRDFVIVAEFAISEEHAIVRLEYAKLFAYSRRCKADLLARNPPA